MIPEALILRAGLRPVLTGLGASSASISTPPQEQPEKSGQSGPAFVGSSQPVDVGIPADQKEEYTFAGVSTDTRTLKPGDLFVCLKGPNFDAHEFVLQALQKGAAGLVIEASRREFVKKQCDEFRSGGGDGTSSNSGAWKGRATGPTMEASHASDSSSASASSSASHPGPVFSGFRIYECQSPVESMQRMAQLHRQDQGYTVFGITGSNGKTSAKEMLLGMLSFLLGEEKVDATRGNLNNHIGVPLTILNLKPGTTHAIVEMGMNHAGEIHALSKISRPDHGLITSIGRAHIEFFYSKRGIARAKQEMVPQCSLSLSYPVSGIGKSLLFRRDRGGSNPSIQLFGFEDSQSWSAVPHVVQKRSLWTQIRAESPECSPRGIRWNLEREGRSYSIHNAHYFSRVQAENLLGCISVLLAAGFTMEEVTVAASRAAPISEGRFQILQKEGRVLVDDTYNANPDSFLAAIDSLRKMKPDGRLLCLAGSMAELGMNSESGHREVGRSLATRKFHLLVSGAPSARDYLYGFTEMSMDEQSGFASDLHQPLDRPYGPSADGSFDLERFFFPDSEHLADYIERHPQIFLSYDGILAKGSRSSRMEIACDALKRIGYV